MAVLGFGTQIQIFAPSSQGSSSYTWQSISDITDIPSLPDAKPKFAVWHTYDGSGAANIQPTGQIEEAEFEVTIKYMPKTRWIHRHLRDLYASKTEFQWRIIKTDNSGKQGQAFIAGFEESPPLDETNDAKITFKVNGAMMEF